MKIKASYLAPPLPLRQVSLHRRRVIQCPEDEYLEVLSVPDVRSVMQRLDTFHLMR